MVDCRRHGGDRALVCRLRPGHQPAATSRRHLQSGCDRHWHQDGSGLLVHSPEPGFSGGHGSPSRTGIQAFERMGVDIGHGRHLPVALVRAGATAWAGSRLLPAASLGPRGDRLLHRPSGVPRRHRRPSLEGPSGAAIAATVTITIPALSNGVRPHPSQLSELAWLGSPSGLSNRRLVATSPPPNQRPPTRARSALPPQR